MIDARPGSLDSRTTRRSTETASVPCPNCDERSDGTGHRTGRSMLPHSPDESLYVGRRRNQAELDRIDRSVRFASAGGEPGEALPGQAGQLVGQLAAARGRRRPATSRPRPGHADDRGRQGPARGTARPASAAMIIATRSATQRRNSATSCWNSASSPRASVNSRRKVSCSGRRADVGPNPAPQPLLVALGLAEGGLQLVGEPAQLAGQQGRVQRPLGGEVLVEHGLGDAGGLGDGLDGGAGSRRGRTAAGDAQSWARRSAARSRTPIGTLTIPPPCAGLPGPAS